LRFTLEDFDYFADDLMQDVVNLAYQTAYPNIPSRTLRDAMTKQVRITRAGYTGALYIPHFWALFVHDGRGGFGPQRATFLVYFVNDADDPRKPTPERAKDQRRLTKAEFQAGLGENRRLEQLNPAGGPMQHMIVVKDPFGDPARVGRAEGTPFFSPDYMQPFLTQVDNLVFEKFDAFIRRNVGFEKVDVRVVL
jgi:hypothetical protein